MTDYNTTCKSGTLKTERKRFLLNSRDVTNRTSSSKLKTLPTSNHEEADTKIVYCCNSFNKPCIVKTKDIGILTLMTYAYLIQ